MRTFSELKRNAKCGGNGFSSLKMAIVGDVSTQLLCTALKGEGVERGYDLEIFEGEFGQVEHLFLSPDSDLYAYNPDFVVIFQSTIKLLEKYSLLDTDKQVVLTDERIYFLASICENPQLKDKRIIYFNYPEIDDTVFGSYSNKMESSFTYQVRKLNFELMNISAKYRNLFICDLSAIQNKMGRDHIFASNIYVSTEMVLNLDALPVVASRTMDIVCAAKGQFKKCLICDLDNTLWGGVIGDDGMEGIQIGHGLGIGKAFTELQEWVRKLKQRGIIICISSKNDENIAQEPFLHHPDMVLKLDDIAVFMANWETKVDNIRHIQSILNISFDSMVFLDDNPFERNIVRENIKGITVPELPEDPGDYLEYLYSLNLFETASYSTTDKNRTTQYQVEAKRMSLKNTFENEADFLHSLDMESEVSGFTKFNIPRVAQLSQRSNQFNLRTVRYTESDCEQMASDAKIIDLCFTLKDKFGDNGLVAIVILKDVGNETLFVDSWIMSCRVLKRGMENFTLNTIVEIVKAKGYKHIIGEYLCTAKNKMVENHYPSLGFKCMEGDETNSARYVLDVDDFISKENFITKK